MAFDQQDTEQKKFLKDTESIEEVDGALKQSQEKDKLMKSVLEGGEEDNIDMGKVITESASRGLGNFTPDLFFEHLVTNFDNAERMYGDSLIRELSGYSPDYIRKNSKIPEFKRELKDKLEQSGKELKKNKVINKEGDFSEETIELASVLMLTQELDKIESSDMGPRINERGSYGLKGDIRSFKNDRYKNIAIKQTIKTAIRRGHKDIQIEDFRSHNLDKHKTMNIIYALDTSGSMMGDKLALAKRAGIALSWKSLKEKNHVGLVVFNAEIREFIPPCKEIKGILKALTGTKASAETDFSKAIDKSIELFKNKKGKKHLLLVTDGMPTKGKLPITKAYESASKASAENISISILGIGLEEKGEEIAKKITEIGSGKFYVAQDNEDFGNIVLEDYYESIKH